MASLGSELVSSVLGHSASEAAFRPWWDNLRDFLVYGLVSLGIVVLPTAIIMNKPLDCTRCVSNFCDDKFDDQEEIRDESGFNIWWVSKFCTATSVNRFVLYFPYSLLGLALVLVLIERGTLRIFRSGLKLDTFYRLLVKEHLNQGANENKGSVEINLMEDVEEARAAIELSYSFSDGSRYFRTYIVRALGQMTVNICLLGWLLILGIPSISTEQFVYCDVHGYHYECAGHPQQFYVYILFIVTFILAGHLLCCFYSILWVLYPRISTLGAVMSRYQRKLRQQSSARGSSLLGKLYAMYYGNRDLRILLNLLAESSGVPLAIRILAMFDAEFAAKLGPTDLEVRRENAMTATVAFDEPHGLSELFGDRLQKRWPSVSIVEIIPAIKNNSIHAFSYGSPSSASINRPKGMGSAKVMDLSVESQSDIDENNKNINGIRRQVRFDHLRNDVEYTIRVSTLVSGRSVAHKWEKIPSFPQ